MSLHRGLRSTTAGATDAEYDAIVVLAGGVFRNGSVHADVARRLDEAIRAKAGTRVPIICSGGGTSHKPKILSEAGFEIPEADLMGHYLTARGVLKSDILLEAMSDDTVGNAFFTRCMHVEINQWTSVLIITSQYHMQRTKAIFDWAFLDLAPTTPSTVLTYLASKDQFDDAEARTVRVEKEAASTRSFSANIASKIHTMKEAHHWIFTAHAAYAAQGYLGRKMPTSAKLLASY